LARGEALGSKLEEGEGEKTPESEVITFDRREGEEKTLEGRVHKESKSSLPIKTFFCSRYSLKGIGSTPKPANCKGNCDW